MLMDFSLIESEYHMLLQETSAYLINSLKGRITSTNSAWLEKILGSVIRKDFMNSMLFRIHDTN